jgi:cytochrome c peroxidase
MTLKSDEKFCPYLDHALMLAPYGEVRPCCRFDTNIYDGQFLWDGKDSILEFTASGPLSQIREQANKGEKVAGCWRCYEEENAGIPSMRQNPFLCK